MDKQMEQKQEERQPYVPPMVVYEGVISTRAGSPVGDQDGQGAVDPADLFGN